MHCLVCNTSCTGYHYRTKTCRACAAFFRRTIHLKLRFRCRADGRCSVTKENRYSCRFCRMKKCIDVGMTAGDESTVPLEFHLDTNSTPAYIDILPSLEDEEWFSMDDIFEKHEKFSTFMKAKVTEILNRKYTSPDLSYKMNICQQSTIAYENHESRWPTTKKEVIFQYLGTDLLISRLMVNEPEVKKFISDHYKEMVYFAEFLMELEPFTTLPFSQKAIIYRRWGMTFIHINRVAVSVKELGNDPKCSKMITFNGEIYDYLHTKFDLSSVSDLSSDHLRSLTIKTEVQFDNLYIKQYKKILPDDFEIQYLLMKSLWQLNGIEGISKETLSFANHILAQIDDEIAYYYKYEKKLVNVASRLYKLHNLLTALERIQEYREQDHRMWKTFDIFKVDVCINDLTC